MNTMQKPKKNLSLKLNLNLQAVVHLYKLLVRVYMQLHYTSRRTANVGKISLFTRQDRSDMHSTIGHRHIRHTNNGTITPFFIVSSQ